MRASISDTGVFLQADDIAWFLELFILVDTLEQRGNSCGETVSVLAARAGLEITVSGPNTTVFL